MKHWIERLTDLTAIGSDETDLKSALTDLAESFGFGGYAYLHMQMNNTFAISNYSNEWQRVYFSERYAGVDPVVERARRLRRAFSWDGEADRSRLSREQRSFFSHAADFAIRSGFTIPVTTANGFMSMFTLASDKHRIDPERDIDAIAAAAAVGQLHARIAHLQATPTIEEHAWLDAKEAAYLRWIALGKTVEEVAELHNVKYNSVRVKLSETKKRFNVYTITQLVAVAIRRKLI